MTVSRVMFQQWQLKCLIYGERTAGNMSIGLTVEVMTMLVARAWRNRKLCLSARQRVSECELPVRIV